MNFQVGASPERYVGDERFAVRPPRCRRRLTGIEADPRLRLHVANSGESLIRTRYLGSRFRASGSPPETPEGCRGEEWASGVSQRNDRLPCVGIVLVGKMANDLREGIQRQLVHGGDLGCEWLPKT